MADHRGKPSLQAYASNRLNPLANGGPFVHSVINQSHRCTSRRATKGNGQHADGLTPAEVRAIVAQIDDRFGRGHAREALIKYLSTHAELRLSGRFSDAVGRALFAAVAEATLLAAWMSDSEKKQRDNHAT